MLELFLLNYGIEPTFYESEYNRYWQDAVFGNEELDSFSPDLIFVHTSNRNILKYRITLNSRISGLWATVMRLTAEAE